MAKVDYTYPIEALHGKVKRTHSVGFAMRKETGAKYTQTYTYTLTCPQRGAKRSAAEVCGSGESRKGAHGGRFKTSPRLDCLQEAKQVQDPLRLRFLSGLRCPIIKQKHT